MSDLAAFVLARLAEDEAAARAAGGKRWLERRHVVNDQGVFDVAVADQADDRWAVISGGASDVDTTHIARHDPAWVLADVAAKRRIVAAFERETLVGDSSDTWTTLDCVIRLLAQPWQDHPDFDPAWKVEP